MALEQFQGGGTYDEGKIKYALEFLKDLNKKFKSGDISQADYLSQTQPIFEQGKEFIDALGRGGSKSANAANAAGAQDFWKLEKEFGVYQSGKELLGRELTQTEATAALPRFSDQETGRAYLAELAQQEARSPKALEKKAPEFSGKVGETFQSILGRDATASESDYYGRLLATGDITPYEIEALVKRTPEFNQKEDTAFRGGLKEELSGYNREASGKAREDILSRYKRAGIEDSSGLDFALAESEEDLTGELDKYLSGLSSSQYGGNKALAAGQYQGVLDQYLGNQAYGAQRSDSRTDYLTQRADATTDYNRQMQDYLAYLGGQPKQKKTGLGQGIGTLLGTGIGAFYGQPAAGGAIGGSAGGLFDYLA